MPSTTRIREERPMYQEVSRDIPTIPTEPDMPMPGEWSGRRASEQARRASMARQASGRRRHIDPTTSERDYSREELEFMTAMQDYKRRSGRMFPTWSEVLEVLHSLGYEKAESLAAGEGPATEGVKDARP